MAKLTPARRQYLDIKRQYPQAILMFRMGDFYEMFDDDAEIAARELEITLTARRFGDNAPPVPMAGIPYHALDSYVARLIDRGYHVAVCDQMTEPDGRGIVEREVTRVLTPGTVYEPSLLKEGQANYLMAIMPQGDAKKGQWSRAGLAYVDVSTGEFATTQFEGEDVAVQVLEELARLTPREVLLPQTWAERGVTLPEGAYLTTVQDRAFERIEAEQTLRDHFGVATLDGLGLSDQPLAVGAAAAILAYLHKTQKALSAQLSSLRAYSTSSFMVLDPFTRRNLELTQTLRGGMVKGSLLGVLDHTVTAMGARLLRAWMAQPLLELGRLNARLDAVEALTRQEALRQELAQLLKSVDDLERLNTRLQIGKVSPRDLLGLASSLAVMPRLQSAIAGLPALEEIAKRLDACEEAQTLINQAINEAAPSNNFSEIGTIRPDFSSELAHILNATREARDWIANLEDAERRRTGIASIKVGYNKVFGYYIEVSKANLDKVPSDYVRKQTIAGGERFLTPQLKEYEALVLSAQEEILKLEKTIFDQVVAQLGEYAQRLQRTAKAVAHLDVLLSLATVAVRQNYVRPKLSEGDVLHIEAGRHPVVETLLKDGKRYVPNDTHFDATQRIHIITGPNMSGKSTYIRQVAIIAFMAQIGSFVPAKKAEVGLVDRIFARIGAQDEIHAGQSTFMVEMVETARLLTGSTRRSLVILDEIGRGTSTYDGLAIARAVIEYLHNHPRLNCRTMFATHYHELTELPNVLPRAHNYRVEVSEQGDEIAFLHRVVSGGADRSYGVHVARLAGLPKPVIDRAKELLASLEAQSSDFRPRVSKAQNSDKPQQIGLFAPATEPPALEALRKVKVDELSPIEALTKLYELKRLL
ncbi:MAG: DNA mismatch repair protein MutS [Anaerolineae bacterium]|nr:DNA mismatch repair protein MutS [Anaerolineae bacterium]MDW8171477.1 DNA mismatch repair protein MutS [Anaerolineae bacterium]